mmetsp:Transcript_1310/g.1405  ORF Transcript_1310/g.1405 Transcript_1310/m.1405 type:complete len:304 (+) Transcript_1310:615-1526(+)
MLELLIKVDRNQPSAYYSLFQCCRLLGDQEMALDYLMHAVQLLFDRNNVLREPSEPDSVQYSMSECQTAAMGINATQFMKSLVVRHGAQFVDQYVIGHHGPQSAALKRAHSVLSGIACLGNGGRGENENDVAPEDVATAMHILGNCERKMEKTDEAIEKFRIANNVRRNAKDKKSHYPSLLLIPGVIMYKWKIANDPQEKIELVEQAVIEAREVERVMSTETPDRGYEGQICLLNMLKNQMIFNKQLCTMGYNVEGHSDQEMIQEIHGLAVEAYRGATTAGDNDQALFVKESFLDTIKPASNS